MLNEATAEVSVKFCVVVLPVVGTEGADGLNVYPAKVGVTTYVPPARPVKL
jgi:hypothetical protein